MATYNGHNEDASGNILLSIGNGMTATLETGTTASQAYTKGAYLYYNNRLCKATTAIASGNTLTIGTNIAYTSLGAELTSHLRASNGNEFYFDLKDGKAGYYPTSSKTASQFVPFGGANTLGIFTNNITITDSMTYIATGAFLDLHLVRPGVSSRPSIRVYVKTGTTTYEAVSDLTAIPDLDSGTRIETTANNLPSGELYIQKQVGSNFTTRSFKFRYIY